MEEDRVFAEKKDPIPPFEFNREVTAVFDNMLTRSVPLYQESIQRQAQMALGFYQAGTRIYDLGCSHGNLGMLILEQFEQKPFAMVACDSSLPMIERYQSRLGKKASPSPIDLVWGRMEEISIDNASVVLINLTLQFLEREKRDGLIQKIYKGLVPGGILLLTEKISHSSKQVSDLAQAFYGRFKRENGYSDLEISQKREALEKVLMPEPLETHLQRIDRAGFPACEVWLKWFNFASMVAIK